MTTVEQYCKISNTVQDNLVLAVSIINIMK
jgi:hypothetical protein